MLELLVDYISILLDFNALHEVIVFDACGRWKFGAVMVVAVVGGRKLL